MHDSRECELIMQNFCDKLIDCSENSNRMSAQKLLLITFGCGWLGWKWISTFQVLSVYFRDIPLNSFCFVLPRRKSLIFSSLCYKSNFMLQKKLCVKYLSGYDQNVAKFPCTILDAGRIICGII